MKYFIYCRKSSEEEERQALSIEAQLTELREFARKENLTVVKEFIESKSAKTPGREVFDQMLSEIEEGKVDGIISWHPDRLARNSVDGGRIIYLIDIGKIQSLKFPTFWTDLSPQGKFNLSIAFGQAKYFTDQLKVNVHRGIRQKIRRGEFPGWAPLGYFNHHKTRTIEPDPETFELVKSFLEKFARGGMSQKELRQEMFDAGITGRTGKPLAYGSISHILKNPFYHGVFRLKGELHDGSHKAMITKDTFDKIQEVLEQNPKKINFQKSYKNTEKNFLFSGLADCGECGFAVTQEWHKKKSGLVFKYYRCTHKSKGYECSQRKYLREEELGKQIKALVSRISLNNECCEKLTNMAKEWKESEQHSSEAEIHRLRDKLEATKSRLNKLLDLHLDGDIETSEYKAKKNSLMNSKSDLESQINKITREGNLWFEPTIEFLEACNHAHQSVIQNNFKEMTQILKRTGLNSKIQDKTLSLSFLDPFNYLSELRSVKGTCSSTDQAQKTRISKSQMPGGWGYKKTERQRPTELGIRVAEGDRVGLPLSPVTAEMPIRPLGTVSESEWLYMKEYEPTGWQG